MFKYLGTAAVLVATTLLFTGCPNAKDIASGLSQALTAEQVSFDEFAKTTTIHGDLSVDSLGKWAAALADVNGRVSALIERMNNKPGERDAVRAQLDQLKGRLDGVFSRFKDQASASIHVQFVPPWRGNDASTYANRVKATYIDLFNNYERLFGLKAPGASNVSVTFSSDDMIVDTYQDCVTSFQLYGLGVDDKNCVSIARERCGHQTEKNCLAQVILLSAGQKCAKEMIEKDEHGRTVGTRLEVGSWMNGITTCRSATPILRNRAGL